MSGIVTKLAQHRVLIISVAIVAAIFGFSVVHASKGSGKPASSTTADTLAPASLVSEISSIPTSVFDQVGTGSATGTVKAISAPALTSGGKPEVFYTGAEFCPYCAAERWAMAVALSRFGTFSKLKETHSSTSDVYANTKTLSFYGSTYSSPYLSFVPVETFSNVPSDNTDTGYEALQTPTSDEQTLINTYDNTPYLPSNEAGSIPFIDFGGRDLIAGASYDPAVLQGLSWSQIATDLHKPNSSVAKNADGAANLMTAALCKLTNNQPATACDQTVQQIESRT